ncbi:hypothetical protein C3L33_22352, partial [Rhododendron williamsianum]
HAAAEIALNTLANRGPSKVLASKVLTLDVVGLIVYLKKRHVFLLSLGMIMPSTLDNVPLETNFFLFLVQDETGVYKNLLQETAHRAGINLPVYTTVRSGPGHVPVFSCTVELAGMTFSGEPAKTKKQAQKNAAIAAWSALKQCTHQSPFSINFSNVGSTEVIFLFPSSSLSLETEGSEEQEQVFPHRNGYVSNVAASTVITAAKSTVGTVSFTSSTQSVPTSFYMPNKLTTSPVREKSTVTIQEIKEDKTEESSNLCKAEVLNPLPLHDHSKTDMTAHEPVHDLEKQKSGVPQARNMNSQFRPVQFHEQTQQSFDSHKSNLRLQHVTQASSHRISRPAAVSAAPVMSKTVGQASSVGPRFQRTGNRMPAPLHMRTGAAAPNSIKVEFGRVPSHFMAPSVQIRSVTPVCSAPPVRNMTNSSQVGESSKQEVKSGKLEDQSAAGSEVGKLQM